ncbi:MAG: hypothetical protein HYZ37_03640 [Candidatus Solibacter usitatus]|nr:hypothetical protein [Candidatus Solibacter usitatus]
MRILTLLLAAAPLFADPVISARKGNQLTIRFDNGDLEIEFVTPSVFRVRRGLAGPPKRPLAEKAVDIKTSVSKQGLRLETNEFFLDVTPNGLLRVSLPALELYREESVSMADGKAEIQVHAAASERFYGLGPRPQDALDARGLVLQPATPFYISGRGYALWMATPTPFRFDVAKTNSQRLSITTSGVERVEYYFDYGPSLKEMWDGKLRASGAVEVPGSEIAFISGPRVPRGVTSLKEASLCGDARALVHATLSGLPIPAIDLSNYRTADDVTFRRAARLAAFAPAARDSAGMPFEGAKETMAQETRNFRKRLLHFLITYTDETRARGYPIIHPLLHQFPRDPIAGQHIDEYMFGDEFLVIPVCESAALKNVYLPMGNWTDWNTHKQYKGRQNADVPVPADGLIVLVKNGSIVPLAGLQPGEPTELHYFPTNGGEFFLLEPDIAEWTQAHAGPAADIYRVEVESKVSRRYEWVVYQMNKPRQVVQVDGGAFAEAAQVGPLAPRQWRYNAAARTVRIGIDAAAGSDVIVNLLFQ